MSAFQYFTKIDIVKHVKASGGLLSEYSIGDPEQRQLKLKHAWHWFVRASTNDGRPLIGGTNLIWMVVDWVASGSGPCTNGTHKCPRNLAHDFGVSPRMCNHVSYPSWRF